MNYRKLILNVPVHSWYPRRLESILFRFSRNRTETSKNLDRRFPAKYQIFDRGARGGGVSIKGLDSSSFLQASRERPLIFTITVLF